MLKNEPGGVVTCAAAREWSPSRRTHALVFSDPDRTVAAVRRLQQAGFVVVDVYSPFPIHGLEDVLGLRPTRLGVATLVAGAIGGIVALWFQIWVHTVDWPLDIGGKDDLALPGLIPVTFELTVLAAALATVFAFLWRRGLFPRLSGAPRALPHPRVTDDRFAVLVDERNAGFDPRAFRAIGRELEPEEIVEGWRVE
ncbi:MAG: DUF3341 domain-containing protein [Planctomycetota bacterium]